MAAGLLESGKGHHGGFRLARAPAAISFRAILAALDADTDPNRCSFGWGKCNAQKPCLLHPAVSKLNASVFEWAARSTLGGLVTERRVGRASARGKAPRATRPRR